MNEHPYFGFLSLCIHTYFTKTGVGFVNIVILQAIIFFCKKLQFLPFIFLLRKGFSSW